MTSGSYGCSFEPRNLNLVLNTRLTQKKKKIIMSPWRVIGRDAVDDTRVSLTRHSASDKYHAFEDKSEEKNFLTYCQENKVPSYASNRGGPWG